MFIVDPWGAAFGGGGGGVGEQRLLNS